MKEFYLKNITLHNFRRFEDTIYELNPQMNVFIGKNASGKTTVLEAVTVVLGAYLSSFKQYVPSRFVQNISDRDVMRKSLQTMKNVATTSGVPQYPCIVESEIAFDGTVAECKRSLEKEGGRTKSLGKNVLREVVSEWEKAIKAADGSDNAANISIDIVFEFGTFME